MNNAQFRRLVQDTPTSGLSNGASPSQPRSLGSQTPALGSRMRSSIPMTPRTIAGGGSHSNDFARQLAERNAELNGRPTKKFRSSAAPKGSKLGSGYTDRTQSRISEEEDEKSVRVKALEEQVKLGQLAPETFLALREQIIGDDVKDVHLVKGLDYKLLARVRKGEDVLSEPKTMGKEPEKLMKEEGPAPDLDVDGEFEQLEGKDIQPLAKEEKVKKGEMAVPPAPMAGKKRTRDDILRDLRASRAKAAEEAKAQLPRLGPRFSKLGAKKEDSRIEKDSKGREVLITTDAKGNVKRKVKKAKVEDANDSLLMPDKDVAPLGMDVSTLTPASAPAPPEETDEDIFGDVGKDYNPLASLHDEDNDDDNDSDNSDAPPKAADEQAEKLQLSASAKADAAAMPPPPRPAPVKRNYFNDTPSEDDIGRATAPNSLQDPTILAALKKASTITPLGASSDPSSMDDEAAKLARRKKMLENNDRDADDMDLEFGSSRFGDQEDLEDSERIKLSVWDGHGGGGGEGGGKRGGKKERKRAPKKRKGDVNSAADVLRAMEAQKGKS